MADETPVEPVQVVNPLTVICQNVHDDNMRLALYLNRDRIQPEKFEAFVKSFGKVELPASTQEMCSQIVDQVITSDKFADYRKVDPKPVEPEVESTRLQKFASTRPVGIRPLANPANNPSIMQTISPEIVPITNTQTSARDTSTESQVKLYQERQDALAQGQYGNLPLTKNNVVRQPHVPLPTMPSYQSGQPTTQEEAQAYAQWNSLNFRDRQAAMRVAQEQGRKLPTDNPIFSRDFALRATDLHQQSLTQMQVEQMIQSAPIPRGVSANIQEAPLTHTYNHLTGSPGFGLRRKG